MEKRNQRRVLLFQLCLVVVVSGGVLLAYLRDWPIEFWHRDKIRAAELAVLRVEEYRRTHSRLPVELRQAGIVIPDSLGIYYQVYPDQRYVVGFGLRLGESYAYDSESRVWK
jgi:hypothetical protein